MNRKMDLIKFALDKIANAKTSGDVEDAWFAYDINTDVNIWEDETGDMHASAYDVVNGRTQTDTYTELF